LLDWQNRTLRNDYRHAQPLNGRVVESSFRPNLTQGKGSQQTGLRLSPSRGKKPVWKELSCKSLKLGMVEVTLPRSSSVPMHQVEMAHMPAHPCQHVLLLMVQGWLKVGCQPLVLTAVVSHRSAKIHGATWPHKNTRFRCVCIHMVRYTDHGRKSSGMAD